MCHIIAGYFRSYVRIHRYPRQHLPLDASRLFPGLALFILVGETTGTVSSSVSCARPMGEDGIRPNYHIHLAQDNGHRPGDVFARGFGRARGQVRVDKCIVNWDQPTLISQPKQGPCLTFNAVGLGLGSSLGLPVRACSLTLTAGALRLLCR